MGILTLGVLARFLPHMPNFVPITAIALFAGCYLSKRWGILIPLIAMIVSDYFIGFSDVSLYVYGGLIFAFFAGNLIRNHLSTRNVVFGTLASSIAFFVVTNFGVWQQGWYPHTLQGLITCYTLAIPFFRNSLLGDIVYVGAMFGVYEFVKGRYLIKSKSDFRV